LGTCTQTRSFVEACGAEPTKIRNVSFPVSKAILKDFNIPKDLKIKEE